MPFELYSTATKLTVMIFAYHLPLYFLEVLLLIFLQPTNVMPERFIRRPFRWLIDRPTRTLTQRLVEDKVKQLVFLFHLKPVEVNLLKSNSTPFQFNILYAFGESRRMVCTFAKTLALIIVIK